MLCLATDPFWIKQEELVSNEFISNRFSARARHRTLAIMIFLVLGVLAVSARGWLDPRRHSKVMTSHTAAVTVQTITNSGEAISAPMEVERIRINRNGFEPSAISRPAGKFLLAFDNQAKVDEAVSVEIYRVNGQRLHELKANKGQPRQQRILDLPAGEYVLKEANHPQWNCTILIAPN